MQSVIFYCPKLYFEDGYHHSFCLGFYWKGAEAPVWKAGHQAFMVWAGQPAKSILGIYLKHWIRSSSSFGLTTHTRAGFYMVTVPFSEAVFIIHSPSQF